MKSRTWFIFVALAMLAFSVPTSAVEVEFDVTYPTTDCDGNQVFADKFGVMEVYISDRTMPGSDLVCSAVNDPELPGEFVSVVRVPPTDIITLELVPGKTYYLRFRFQGPGNIWTNLSKELVYFVPYIQVRAPSAQPVGEE